jgi:hypothetical protein
MLSSYIEHFMKDIFLQKNIDLLFLNRVCHRPYDNSSYKNTEKNGREHPTEESHHDQISSKETEAAIERNNN